MRGYISFTISIKRVLEIDGAPSIPKIVSKSDYPPPINIEPNTYLRFISCVDNDSDILI